VRILTVLVAALALAAQASAGRIVGIGEQKNGRNVKVHVGDLVVVTLRANPSTGYAWRVSALNRRLLAPDATGYIGQKVSAKVVGSSGVAVLLFRALALGKTPLRLAYVGPGTAHPVGRRFAITVQVARRG
jgi:inhibitor of cysteine peptidase